MANPAPAETVQSPPLAGQLPAWVLYIFWSLLAFGSLGWNIIQLDKGTLSAARVTAEASYKKDLLYRQWNAMHGGVYVTPTADTPPNPYLDVPGRDITTSDGAPLTLINPAYMTRQVFEIMEAQTGIHSHITSLRPLNPGNRPDAWERQSLQAFEEDSGESTTLGQTAAGEVFRLMRPLYVEKACLKCHSEQGYKLGEVRGGISVMIPMQPLRAAAHEQLTALLLGHGTVWLFGLFGLVGGMRRLGRQLDMEQQMALRDKEHENLQMVMNGISEAIVLIDQDYRIRMSNPAAREFFGASPEQPPLCYEVIHKTNEPCDSEVWGQCPLKMAEKEGRAVKVVHSHKHNDGRDRIVELYATPLWEADGRFKGIIKVARDITERVQAERDLEHLAMFDTVTRLPNRLNFEGSLQEAVNTQQSGPQQNLAVFFIDLDRFKNINDALGHHIGDQILAIIAARITRHVPEGGMVARFGGDEFTLLWPNFSARAELTRLARQIQDELAEELHVQDYALYTSASIGISTYPLDGRDAASLMKSADTALYRAKRSGRNAIEFHASGDDSLNIKRLRLEHDLHTALLQGQITVYYQPQYDAVSQRITGMEALSHWEHPEFGAIPPSEFIPIAEETGLIDVLGLKVLHKACQDCRQWNEGRATPLRVAVNISAREFLHRDILGDVQAILKETGLAARYLELEITESIIMQDIDIATTTLRRLRHADISVAIDDFGTGYSSLGYLKQFPVNCLKIDRSFVEGLPHDPADTSLVKAVIGLAQTFNMKVVAEGVETGEQAVFLREQGCDILQGFHFSRPIDAEAFTRLLQSQ